MKQLPGANPYKLADLIPIVREALQQNTSFTDLTACNWLQRAILEITDNYPFEELRTIGPTVLIPLIPTMINGVPFIAVPVSEYINGNDDITLQEDPVISISPTVRYSMDYMVMKALTPLTWVPGAIPFKYTRWGPYFVFGGRPNERYPTYLPYQIRHPFAPDGNLQSSPCMFPVAWNETVAYAAALRGAQAMRWSSIASFLMQLLHGDPANQEGNPGMIKELVAQNRKDQRNSSRQLQVRIERY